MNEVWTVLFAEAGWGSDIVGIYSSLNLALEAMMQYNEREDHGILDMEPEQQAWGTIYYCDDGSYEIQRHILNDMPADWGE